MTFASQSPTSPRGTGTTNVLLGAMMFLEFYIWGSWYVTTGPFMAANGMADFIAHAYSVAPIAAILSPLFLGLIADRFFATERVLGVMHLLGGIVMFAAPQVSGWAFIGILLLHALCFMPTLGLTSTLAFHNIVNREKSFPIIRVFGTIGWIVAAYTISLLSFDTSANQYYVTGVASFILAGLSFALPHTPPPAKGERFSVGTALGLDALRLLKRPSFLVFIIASLLICIPLSAYYAYAGTFVGASGAFSNDGEPANVAFWMSFGQVSEIFFMLVMPLCFARLGVKWMLAIGMLAWVVRYGLFGFAATSTGTPAFAMILGGILLHGVCYDFFFVTGQIYTDQQSTARIRGQAQGFLVLITQGVGMLIGAQLAGLAFGTLAGGAASLDSGDWRTFWLLPCIMAGVILIAFYLFFRETPPVEDETGTAFEPVADPAAAAPVEPAPAVETRE
jgi:nucleoside transporter